MWEFTVHRFLFHYPYVSNVRKLKATHQRGEMVFSVQFAPSDLTTALFHRLQQLIFVARWRQVEEIHAPFFYRGFHRRFYRSRELAAGDGWSYGCARDWGYHVTRKDVCDLEGRPQEGLSVVSGMCCDRCLGMCVPLKQTPRMSK